MFVAYAINSHNHDLAYFFHFIPNPAIVMCCKYCLLFTSTTNIQVHFRLEFSFFMKANNMIPDQGSSLIWVHIFLQYRLPKNISTQEEQTKKWWLVG